ncbi:MAG: glutaminase, partial [Synergistaceae bacterium]|nr:glutaminase [Synergistaceae bacterium]
MKELLDSVVEEFRDIWRNGRVATYIPELARACPDAVGLAVCDLGSGLYTAGDWNYPFTMQSVSKIVSLALALTVCGEDAVFSSVGMDP